MTMRDQTAPGTTFAEAIADLRVMSADLVARGIFCPFEVLVAGRYPADDGGESYVSIRVWWEHKTVTYTLTEDETLAWYIGMKVGSTVAHSLQGLL